VVSATLVARPVVRPWLKGIDAEFLFIVLFAFEVNVRRVCGGQAQVRGVAGKKKNNKNQSNDF
jgi:hypothetical protein